MTAKKPLFAFFGTPRFAVKVLDALESHGYVPALVITAPDKPQGRGLELKPAPAKAWALERSIDVTTPSTLKDEVFITELQNTDWDVFVVAAYAKLINKKVLDIPRKGCLNVHPSLLPKFRGPSPTLSAILADERSTGVSIMLMDEQLDHGPIIAQAKVELESDAWPPNGSLFEDLLATEGGNLLAEVMEPWINSKITPEPQDELQATFTKKFIDKDAYIPYDTARFHLTEMTPAEALRRIRAFDKNPRAHFFTPDGKRIIIVEAVIEDAKLVIKRVTPEGKKEMDYKDFLRSS